MGVHWDSNSQCRNPTLREVWGRHSHSRNGDLGVLWDSQKFRIRLQGSKHLALKCSLYCWKGLEAYMLKMASHGPFGHLQHKLCVKERPRVKLAVWFPTIKSRESTDLGACRRNATRCWKALKESYKFASNLILIEGLSKELWAAKIPGVQTGIVSGLPLESPETKRPFGCGPRGVVQNILYGGRWWLPASPGYSESSESRVARGLS